MSLPFLETARLPLVGAAAIFAVAAAVGAEPGGALEDVQIGERGDILRIALICATDCDVAPGEGVEFVINGVAASLDLDISDRSALAKRLTIVPENGASVLRIGAARRINGARIVACQSDTGVAPCVEYRFEPSPTLAARETAEPANKPTIRADRDDHPAPAPKPSHPGEDIPFIGSLLPAPDLSLRDEPAAGLLYLPEFAPPERLSPPRGEKRSEEKSSDRVDVGRPALIVVDRAEAIGAGAGFDIKEEAADILGKSFSVGACEGARARLMADAWALEAMIDLAFCKAADGKLEEADADFARLLAYTPDNYEALVGRGLIAIASGERERGLSYFQDALNALPPIDESDRIVEAMQRN